jgi:hypothetical protein
LKVPAVLNGREYVPVDCVGEPLPPAKVTL